MIRTKWTADNNTQVVARLMAATASGVSLRPAVCAATSEKCSASHGMERVFAIHSDIARAVAVLGG